MITATDMSSTVPPLDVVYEDTVSRRNLLACPQMVTVGRPRHDAWVTNQLLHDLAPVNVWSLQSRPRRYVFPIGLFHAPVHWTADPGPFSWLPRLVLDDARAGKVLFIFDQSQEGNADPALWSWFHDHCRQWQIDPCHVVYLTSDHLAERRYAEHRSNNQISDGITVISSLFNLYILNTNMRHAVDIPKSETVSAKPWLFNCLNRMLHQHRKWFFCKMLQADLLSCGMVSMDRFTDIVPYPGMHEAVMPRAQALLPLVVDRSDFQVNMFADLNTQIYRDSWFTVITETYVNDAQMLIGEKVFKPMMCFSPFFLLSTRGSLARLRELGFKTFPMLWDESYDIIDDPAARMDAIIEQMLMISSIDDKAAWLSQAESELAHNHRLAWQTWDHSRDYQNIVAIWQDFLA